MSTGAERLRRARIVEESRGRPRLPSRAKLGSLSPLQPPALPALEYPEG
jgi:hypothetical protein